MGKCTYSPLCYNLEKYDTVNEFMFSPKEEGKKELEN